MKKRQRNNKKKYYHTSNKRLRVGQILRRGDDIRRVGDAKRGGVFMTTSPVPHYTVLLMHYDDDEKDYSRMHVYEVAPIGKVRTPVYRSNRLFGEVTADQAEVVRYVGNGWGILKRSLIRYRVNLGAKEMSIFLEEQSQWLMEVIRLMTGGSIVKLKKGSQVWGNKRFYGG